MKRRLMPEDWGLAADTAGRLLAGHIPAVELARIYGTPLHVLHLEHLERRARQYQNAARSALGPAARPCYAFKCNSLPALVSAVRGEGFGAEVMTPFELALALRLGFRGEEIIVNGPSKTPAMLQACLEAGARYIVLDSLSELDSLAALCREHGPASVLLRVNPDVIPRGVSRGSATGSRRHSVFGLDLRGGEVEAALDRARGRLDVGGFHLHLGTGIRSPEAYREGLRCLGELLRLARSAGVEPKTIDVGGGIASPTSREYSSAELLLSTGFGHSPGPGPALQDMRFEEFFEAIGTSIRQAYGALPEIILEPGRSIASQAMMLLLSVLYRKESSSRWLITDGGLGTVTLPTYYEYHEILLANDVRRPVGARVTITGPGCFAGDLVARNRPMPRVRPGEVLAVMDSGAYFLALESSFGHPRPAVVAVRGGDHRCVRRRESFEDMVARDTVPTTEETPR